MQSLYSTYITYSFLSPGQEPVTLGQKAPGLEVNLGARCSLGFAKFWYKQQVAHTLNSED